MNRANGETSSTRPENDFSDENELDLCNLIDADEPELRELDDNDDRKNENHVKADVLSVMLSEYGDDGLKLAENFRINKIEYKDLSALSDNDLKQFGILNAEKRKQLLFNFSGLVNQQEHYDKELSTLNRKEYAFEGLKNIEQHLYYLKLAITGSLLKLRMEPAEDVYVSNDTNASELVLKTLEEMKKTSNLMEKQLMKLSTKKNNKKTSKYSNCWKFVLLLGATAVSSAILFKYYRTKFIKV